MGGVGGLGRNEAHQLGVLGVDKCLSGSGDSRDRALSVDNWYRVSLDCAPAPEHPQLKPAVSRNFTVFNFVRCYILYENAC